ncbi:four-carbon acid sugar kinase family protein [Rhizobium sp. AQ_MP]|uniref:four-carbon acid sugar kinase family protein n=1 Tax=Rhizobium sp. AQ_MP TaxID=2761536 RepID=UPI0016396B20|nr:four-carbon acid sugar kinase family protein [Rhizobium sp. AQ_MP]
MLVIVADDLTGALDTAAPFAARGLHTEVVLKLGAVAHGLALSPDVLSINLATREKSPEEAFRLMRHVIGLLPRRVRLFKKIDSRLKGHISAELDAITYQRALVSPAIPAFKRVVLNGSIEGFGVATPIPIVDVLGQHAVRALIPDALADGDLIRALEVAEASHVDLLVGARGLAEALAFRMTGRADAELVAPPAGAGLFVIGSHDRITTEQVEQLRRLDLVAFNPAPNGVMAPSAPDPARVVLVQATGGETQISSEKVSENLARSVHPRLTSQAQTMLLCGGATAEAVLDNMGIECFRLEGECMPGLGLAHARGQCIIAKSGGFGQPDTLVKLAEQLHGGRR